jgi:hypothetical protein
MVKTREAWKLTTKNYWNRAYGGLPKAAKEVQQLPTCISPLFPRGVDVFESRRVNCKGCHTAFHPTVCNPPCIPVPCHARARFPRGQGEPVSTFNFSVPQSLRSSFPIK